MTTPIPTPESVDARFLGEVLRGAGFADVKVRGVRAERIGTGQLGTCVRYALELNGASGWIMTNLDVLSGFERIPVATAYRIGGRRMVQFPAELPSLDGVQVEFTEQPGWSEDITGARTFEELPLNARRYVQWVEEQSGFPIAMLSVGPERGQVIPRHQHSLTGV